MCPSMVSVIFLIPVFFQQDCTMGIYLRNSVAAHLQQDFMVITLNDCYFSLTTLPPLAQGVK